MNQNHQCINCGNQFEGSFCNKCGEKVHTEHSKKISHLLNEALHFLVHLDGSFFRTLKTIFTRPGKLSLDYCNGLRKKYFKPISLFLVCVVLYLLFPMFEGLNMKLNTYVDSKYNFTWIAVPVVKNKINSKDISYKALAEKYDKKSAKISKIFLLAYLPLMSLVLYLLFFKRRRYFFDHFILATEFGSVWIAIQFLFFPAIMVIGNAIEPGFGQFFEDSNWVFWWSLDVLFLFILTLQFKTFYDQKWSWTILKAIVFMFIFRTLIQFIYHSLLFLITMLFL